MPSCAYDIGARRCPLVAAVLAVGTLTALAAAGADNNATAQASQAISAHADEFQQVPGFIVLADRRMFTVMAFLNAAGYDSEAKGNEMPPLRAKVRQMVAANLQQSPQKLASWQRRYAGYVKARFRLPQFQEYALGLTPDYPFRPAFPSRLRQFREFHQVLNDFWQTAKLDAIWEAVKPDYMSEMRAYHLESLPSGVDAVWAYLRMPRSDTFTFTIVPNPLCQSFTAQWVVRGAYHYIVDGPRTGRGFNSHEYLHSIVEPIVKTSLARQRRKLHAYFRASKGRTVYYGTVPNFTSECLIHALTPRLALKRDNSPERRAANEKEIDSLMKGGYLLVRPFYERLAGFESSQLPFDQFVPQLFDEIPSYRP
jgi:hypothetical protein